jgi:molecular chaperone DnaK
LDRLKERSKVAVYDLGGGTFDLSILELRDGVFQVLATHGNTRLGGDDLDRRVVEFLLGKIRQEGGPLTPALSPSEGERQRLAPPCSSLSPSDGERVGVRGEGSHAETAGPLTPALSPSEGEREKDGAASERGGALSILARVREAAEQAKIRLSTETEVEVALPFLTPDFSFNCTLTRAELERLTGDLIHRTREHCLRSLADARLDPKALDQVILVGGQTRMPLVRRLVSEWFGCAEFEEARGGVRTGFHQAKGPQLNTSQNPDEAIALGAAIQAEILSGGFRNLLLLDVTPLSLGLETFGGLMNVIIPRNTTIPVKAGEAFTTAVDFQRQMLIHVLQGERERARDNWSLGQFTLDFQSAPRGVPRVGVQFEIDADGILRVLARDIHTGQEKIVQMKSAVDVEDAAVQQMVEESVEHFFEDTRARQWVEGKLKAIDTAAATRHGLAECGAELDPANREQIERALAALESVLAAEDPATTTGDPKSLQQASQALDEATRPLADLLMDRAMEAMLRKRGAIH